MKSSWALKGNVYVPEHSGGDEVCRLGIDVAGFADGLLGEWVDGSPGLRTCQLFLVPQLQPRPMSAIEHYIREHDLLIRCEETKGQPLEALVVLRQCPEYAAKDSQPQGRGHDCTWFEFVLSIQTSLLDTAPISRLGFRILHSTALQISAMGILPESNRTEVEASPISSGRDDRMGYWLNDGQRSILIAGHSSDLSDLEITTSENTTEIQMQLRASHLEKGVIRRFRSLVAFGQSADVNELQEILSAFEKSSLPLST